MEPRGGQNGNARYTEQSNRFGQPSGGCGCQSGSCTPNGDFYKRTPPQRPLAGSHFLRQRCHRWRRFSGGAICGVRDSKPCRHTGWHSSHHPRRHCVDIHGPDTYSRCAQEPVQPRRKLPATTLITMMAIQTARAANTTINRILKLEITNGVSGFSSHWRFCNAGGTNFRTGNSSDTSNTADQAAGLARAGS